MNKTCVFRRFKESADTLVMGIIEAHEQCPNADNKTFEEVGEWAAQHVRIVEEKSCLENTMNSGIEKT